jgi:hypothetical protein
VCRNGKYQNGFEKVTVYVDPSDDDTPTHMARMLPNGMWTSKMGRGEDIEHDTPHAVEGKQYGKVKAFLRRPNPLCRKPNLLMTFRLFLKKIFGMRRNKSCQTANSSQTKTSPSFRLPMLPNERAANDNR